MLCPQTASTLSAMGYTCALTGSYSKAVDCFHKVGLVVSSSEYIPFTVHVDD